MDLTVISTFRCNSKCQMCYIWKNPTHPSEEITLETLDKLPKGFDNLNVSGGEPTLRRDLSEVVDILYPKASVMEISSNGLRPEKLIPIIKKYPDIKVRFSLEGLGELSNQIRGEKAGFEIKTAGLDVLKDAGGTDLGFAITIQDENVDQLVELYDYCESRGFELATSALHNAWQFYKNDNYFYERDNVARQVEKIITRMLRSRKIKNWFRAYLNLGLIEKILGHDRLIPCTAGKDFVFIDPWSDVWACNVRSDLRIGNLVENGWNEILASKDAKSAREKVIKCTQNCWMVTTARTAMRSNISTKLPKAKPLTWVLHNKLKILFGGAIDFNKYIDYSHVSSNAQVKRESYLGKKVKVPVNRDRHTVDKRYPLIDFTNR